MNSSAKYKPYTCRYKYSYAPEPPGSGIVLYPSNTKDCNTNTSNILQSIADLHTNAEIRT